MALVLVTACGGGTGVEPSGCGPDWIDAEVVVTEAGGTEEQPIPIECMHQVANRRIRVGFILPAGPECHQLARVELSESTTSVVVTLIGAVSDDPAAGACPTDARMVVSEIDLAAPLDHRALLDGSRRLE